MNNEDKDQRCTQTILCDSRDPRVFCVKIRYNRIKEVLSIIVWVEQEIMQEKSRTLLWTASLSKQNIKQI